MTFPVGYRLIGCMYYKQGDRSGPYVIASDGTATLMNVVTGGAVLPLPTLQRVTPSSGETVVVNQTDSVITVFIEGSTPLASLILLLPQPGLSQPGQIVRIVTIVDIASISFGTATVQSVPSQMFSGDGISLQNIEDDNWLSLP